MKEIYKIKDIAIVGGVAANRKIKNAFIELGKNHIDRSYFEIIFHIYSVYIISRKIVRPPPGSFGPSVGFA